MPSIATASLSPKANFLSSVLYANLILSAKLPLDSDKMALSHSRRRRSDFEPLVKDAVTRCVFSPRFLRWTVI